MIALYNAFRTIRQPELAKRRQSMKKHVLCSCTILVVILTALQTVASAQQTPGIEGVWFAHVIPVDCNSRLPILNAPSFRGLNMFIHDGSFSNEAAFPVP